MSSGGTGAAFVVALFLLVSTAAAGPTPLHRPLGSIDQTVSETTTPRLLVEGHTTDYDGNEIGRITLYVNNSGSEFIGEAQVVLTAKNGTVLASNTKSNIVLAPGQNEITVDLSGTYDPRRVSRIRLVAGASL